ncbi:10010_t:CDS:2 [Acaulospora colombiana]|uniref:10010_t:CDS:1 n=1 Tax=Acaulospora colombiana TaxID=27376 RepID=A0ACA9NKT5_9GLOM|nr:10010_t:CDS:2 [Acaulospora colombiana]
MGGGTIEKFIRKKGSVDRDTRAVFKPRKANKEDPQVMVKRDCIEPNRVATFEPVESFTVDPSSSRTGGLPNKLWISGSAVLVLNGAIWVGRARLICNISLAHNVIR